MKWNWGTKIAIFYCSFVAFIIFLVYLSFGQQYDLVTEDYYAEEINYQHTIDSKLRAKALNNELQASIKHKQLIIHFPQKNELISGELECFRPSDQNLDFTTSIETKTGSFLIPIEKFKKGKYRLKVKWIVNEVNYYQELIVIIP